MTSEQLISVSDPGKLAGSGLPKLSPRNGRPFWTSDLVVASLVFLLNICDLVLTFMFVPFRGYELNPIFAALFAQGRWRLAMALKFLPFIVLIAGTGYLRIRLVHLPRVITWGLRFLLVEYTLLVYFLLTQAMLFFLWSPKI